MARRYYVEVGFRNVSPDTVYSILKASWSVIDALAQRYGYRLYDITKHAPTREDVEGVVRLWFEEIGSPSIWVFVGALLALIFSLIVGIIIVYVLVREVTKPEVWIPLLLLIGGAILLLREAEGK